MPKPTTQDPEVIRDHAYVPREIFRDGKRVEEERCGFVTDHHWNSSTSDEDHCSRSPSEHAVIQRLAKVSHVS